MPDDEDDPLGAAKGIYCSILISALIWVSLAIIWKLSALL